MKYLYIILILILSCKKKPNIKTSYLYVINKTNHKIDLIFTDSSISFDSIIFIRTIPAKNTFIDTVLFEYRDNSEASYCKDIIINKPYIHCGYIYWENLNQHSADYLSNYYIDIIFDDSKIISYPIQQYSDMEDCVLTDSSCFLVNLEKTKSESKEYAIESIYKTTITIVENQYLMADSL